jgi:biopolymer transport protein ExbD
MKMPLRKTFRRSRFLLAFVSGAAASLVAAFTSWGRRHGQPTGMFKPLSPSSEPPLVTVAADGTVFLSGERVSPEELARRLGEKLTAAGGREVHLKISRGVPLAEVTAVMKRAREAGASRYRLVRSS